VSNNDDIVGHLCAFFFGKKPDAYFEQNQPVFCGSDRRRLVSFGGQPTGMMDGSARTL
jgi:hypothetical protein